MHVRVDDTSRVAYVEVLADHKAATCIGFLDRAVAWFAAHGVTVERVMTDNGSGYVSTAWDEHCARLEIRHLRTRPYRPRTNGKAERFIQTMLREWPTLRSTKPQNNGDKRSSPGSGDTTTNDSTAPSATRPPSAAFTKKTTTEQPQ